MNKSVSKHSTSEISSVEPVLQYCVFCDNVAIGPGGKPVFIGIFDNLLRPGSISQFFIMLKWVGGIGKHTSSIKILNPDLEPIFTSKEKKMDLLHKAQSFPDQYGFVNFEFPTPGVYWVEVFLNGKSYMAIPLPVHKPE